MQTKPLTILFDAKPLLGKRTGVGYYTAQLIDALAKQHPETTFVGYFYNFLGRKQAPSTPSASNITYRPIYAFPGPVANLLRRFHVPLPVELLALKRSDFILYVNFLGQPSLFNTPSATVIHDLTYIDLPDYVAKKNLSDLRRFLPVQIKRSSFIITVSEFAQKRIQQEFHVPTESVLVTPIPPVAPTPYTKGRQEALLSELHIPGKYFLTLSTVEPRKNVLGMLEAYRLLPETLRSEYSLVIAGAVGWNCEAELRLLKQLQEQGSHVIHLGYVTHEQKTALYQSAVFYTSASHYEGFGMTPLEAMSYGKACALSNIPVFREVAHDAVLYFDKDDPQSIAKAWNKLLTDPAYREKMAQKGKRQADSYQWDDVAASLYNRIEQTLEVN